MLTVESLSHKGKNGHTYWNCRCDCGDRKAVDRSRLISGKTTSCGCKRGGKEDFTGRRFGMLVVESVCGMDKYSHRLWGCRCDCGGRAIARTGDLTNGRIISCGCFKKRRGTRKDLTGRRFGMLTVESE